MIWFQAWAQVWVQVPAPSCSEALDRPWWSCLEQWLPLFPATHIENDFNSLDMKEVRLASGSSVICRSGTAEGSYSCLPKNGKARARNQGSEGKDKEKTKLLERMEQWQQFLGPIDTNNNNVWKNAETWSIKANKKGVLTCLLYCFEILFFFFLILGKVKSCPEMKK